MFWWPILLPVATSWQLPWPWPSPRALPALRARLPISFSSWPTIWATPTSPAHHTTTPSVKPACQKEILSAHRSAFHPGKESFRSIKGIYLRKPTLSFSSSLAIRRRTMHVRMRRQGDQRSSALAVARVARRESDVGTREVSRVNATSCASRPSV